LNLTFTIAEFGGDLHQQSIVLRDQVLRKPLGLRFTDIELAQEIDQQHLVATVDGIVVAVTLLVNQSDQVFKLRQFAVNENLQGQGIGKKLLHFVENTAIDQGKKSIELHAREVAAKFYAQYEYVVVGEPFTEVGLPHFKMRKKL
jgi:predicted GNAT family N-acyltransferase